MNGWALEAMSAVSVFSTGLGIRGRDEMAALPESSLLNVLFGETIDFG